MSEQEKMCPRDGYPMYLEEGCYRCPVCYLTACMIDGEHMDDDRDCVTHYPRSPESTDTASGMQEH